MDELQISGKRFISSRRIAKENGYNTDYIGQLIRGGKIKGQKVGRTWYVDAATFDAYLGEESTQEPVSKKSSGLLSESQPDSAGQTFSQPVPVATDSVAEPEPTVQKTEPVEEAAVEEPAPAVQKIEIKIHEPEVKKAEKQEEVSIPVRKIVPMPPVRPQIKVTRGITTAGGLRYVADDEPLLPEIDPQPEQPRHVPMTSVMSAPQEEVKILERRPGSGRAALVLAAAALVVFAFSAVVSNTLSQTIQINSDAPASVGYTLHW
jgi:hypothetical protein